MLENSRKTNGVRVSPRLRDNAYSKFSRAVTAMPKIMMNRYLYASSKISSGVFMTAKNVLKKSRETTVKNREMLQMSNSAWQILFFTSDTAPAPNRLATITENPWAIPMMKLEIKLQLS